MERLQARKSAEKVKPIKRVLFIVVPTQMRRMILELEVYHLGQDVLGLQPEADLGYEQRNRSTGPVRELQSK
jgi:hypothetical protein